MVSKSLLATTLLFSAASVAASVSGLISKSPFPSLHSRQNPIWQPPAGASWQIVLRYPLNDTTPQASVYIIDLFDNPISTIQTLHSLNRKVICYFSAGSYENWRIDRSNFTAADYKNPLDPIWVGEWWLDTRREKVRENMKWRLQVAKSKGCDGVDPDNVDGYDNDTGFDLTTADGVDYMRFLAREAHALGLSIGLKNGGSIVEDVLDVMQWEVNEQCLEFKECGDFAPFIDAGKPVFHIEYPDEPPPYNATTRRLKCNQSSARGFSTLLKEIELTNYYERC